MARTASSEGAGSVGRLSVGGGSASSKDGPKIGAKQNGTRLEPTGAGREATGGESSFSNAMALDSKASIIVDAPLHNLTILMRSHNF